MHIFDIRLAYGLDKRLLLNVYPVQMAREYANEQGNQAGPVCHRETDPRHGQERPTVGRMANRAVRAILHHLLISGYRDIAGKVASQRPDGIPAQSDTEEKQGHPEKKERCSMPGDRCCR